MGDRTCHEIAQARIGVLASATFISFVFCIGGARWASAQDAGRAEPIDAFSEATTVVAVEIPVIVRRDGRAVRGLGVEDFQVSINGQAVALTAFESVDLLAGDPRTSSLADTWSAVAPTSAAARSILVLVDISSNDPFVAKRIVSSARQFLDGGFHPSDRVAIGVIDGVGATLVSPFSRERASLALDLLAVEAITAVDFDTAITEIVSSLDPSAWGHLDRRLIELLPFRPKTIGLRVRSALSDWARPTTLGPEGMSGTLRMMQAGKREAEQTVSDLENEGQRRAVRDGVLRITESLDDFLHSLDVIRGQRSVLMISPGVAESAFESTSDMSRLSLLERRLQSLARRGWTIYGISTQRIRSARSNGLFRFTEATGGREYRNLDIETAMARFTEDTASAYVLTVQPEVIGGPEVYHTIRVRLRNDKKANISHRHGFHGPKPLDDVPTPILAREDIVWRADGGPVDVALAAIPFVRPAEASGDGVTSGTLRAGIFIEVDGPSALAVVKPDSAVADWHLDVYRLLEDDVESLFSQTVAFDLGQAGAALSAGGFKVFGEVSLPSGVQRIRVVLRSAETTTLATASVTMPASIGPGDRLVMPPIVPDTEARWIPVRQRPQFVADTTSTYPFRLEGGAFMPQASARARVGDDVPVLLMVTGADDPVVKLQVEPPPGSAPIDPSYRFDLSDRQGATTVRRAVLSTAGWAPGIYQLGAAAAGTATPHASAWTTLEIVARP